MKKFLYILLFAKTLSYSQNIVDNGQEQIFYYDNGVVSSKGYIQNGKPNGYWYNYYENGELKSQGNRKDFLLDSNWIFYSPDGFKTEEIFYVKNRKNGISKKYSDSSILFSTTTFKTDTLHGLYTEYYPTGEVHIVKNYVNGIVVDRAYEYAKDGTILTIVDYDEEGNFLRKEEINRTDENGLKTGIWKTYDEQGNIKIEANYKQGKLDGIYRIFNEKGLLEEMKKFNNGEEDLTAQELMFVDLFKTYYPTGEIHFVGAKDDENKKHGIFQEYSKDGKIIETTIYSKDSLLAKGLIDKEGLKQDKWYFYYPTGERKAKGKYVNDKKTGDWLYLYKNEKPEQEGEYKEDLENKEWTWYYPNGQIKRKEYFINGKENGNSIEYDSIGEIIAAGEYVNGLKEGNWYYKLGDHKQEGSYIEGQKVGEWVYTFLSNNQIHFKGAYKNGLEDGKHIFYYDNGNVKEEGKYSLGRKEGDWKKYDEEGNLKFTFTYRAGSLIKADGIKIKPLIPPTLKL